MTDPGRGTARTAAQRGTRDREAVESNRAHALGARNARLLVVGVVGYALLLSLLMIARGVSLTPDVVLVGFGLAAIVLGRGRLFLRDWVPFVALFFAYELMRGYADELGMAVHVGDVIDLERLISLGHLPTQVLQDWLHPASGVDVVAVLAVVVYFLHFPLPLLAGFLLWLRRRPLFYDFVAAIILLCLAGFVTFLFVPVAPPWYAAAHGYLNGPNGQPVIQHLQESGFNALADAFGFNGHYIYSYTFYEIGPNPVAAFPSLHAAFPFLAFLYARRAFGRVGWLFLAYTLVVVFAIVYLGEHYVVDALAGMAYAGAAYVAVSHAPGRVRALLDRARDDALAAPDPLATGGGATPPGAGTAAARPAAVSWRGIAIGGAVAAAGAIGVAVLASRGESTSPLYLVPAAVLLGGLWWAAAALFRR